jgi:hypothetical protein
MEIEGKVIQSLAIQTGESNGKSWIKSGFVIETYGKYPTTVAFEVFGEEKVNDIPQILGQAVRVSFDVKSREYNGKWFHNVTAYKVELAGQQQQQQPSGLLRQPAGGQPQQPMQQVAPPQYEPQAQAAQPVQTNDPLPF